MKFRKFLRDVAINLGVLLGILVALELVFGNWTFGAHLGYLTIARDMVLHRDVSRIYPGGGIATYTRDKYGLRGDYGGDPGNIGLLALGGSTTNELYVSDPDTWVAQLDKRLNDSGYGLKAINAGVDGHSSIAHIRSFEVWFPVIPRLRPKYFLFYLGINEPIADSLERFDLVEEHATWSRIVRGFKNNSAFNNLYRMARGALRAREVRVAYEVEDLRAPLMKVRYDDDPERVARVQDEWKGQLAAYEARVHRLAQLTREWHAIPIFVTQVRGNIRWTGENSMIAMSEGAVDNAIAQRLFNAVTLRVCHEENGFCIDLERELKVEDGDFYDTAHVVASGSRKIAEVIFEDLASHLQKTK